MASFNKFQSFVEALAEKKHNLGSDQLTVALTAQVNPPVSTNTQLSELVTLAPYTGMSSRLLGIASSVQTAGVYALTLNDLVLTMTGASVGPFRYIVIYNDTAANDELIAWYDYGANITLADGETLTLDFTGAALTIT